MRWLKCFRAVALGAAMVPCALAQKVNTAVKVVFKNPGPFAPADLETVAGVHAGQKLSLQDFQAAAQRLVDTGCFEDVHVDSTGTPAALTVIFVLRPVVSGDLHRAEFENFVWLTPEELRDVVHRSAPLFGGTLAETTGVLDAVSAGLQAALAAKGVPEAEVSHELVLATSARPETTVTFRVVRPAVRLGTAVLDGVTLAALPLGNKLEMKLRGMPYRSGDGPGTTADLLLHPSLNAGYKDAKLTGIKTVVAPGGARGAVDVDLTAHVERGPVFRVGSLSFAGTPLVSEQMFAAGAKLHAGDIASREQLLASEAPVDAVYHKLGYMDEYVDPGVTEDAAAHTVSYTLKVVPGEVYRVKTVTVKGLSPEAKAAFDGTWTMKPGELYDAEYAKAFLHSKSLPRILVSYAGSFEAAADPSTHTVDLTVKFVPVGGR